MLADDVRLRIFEEHAWLREEMRLLTEAAEAVVDGQRESVARLLTRGERFCTGFLRHLDYEERILVPVLRDADPWGPERVRQVKDEHAEQRTTLQRVLRDIADPDVPHGELAQELLDVVGEIAIDMVNEEATMLSPEVLRDDVITIDAAGS